MASKVAAEAVADLGWDEFAEALVSGTVRGAKRTRVQAALEEVFYEEELRSLRRLAAHARLVRSRTPPLGNVVFLHGITGSNLVTVDAKGDRDQVWVHLPRLLAGRIARLKLRPDASAEADAAYKVETAGLNKTYYARAVLGLGARWDVEPFAYDWRKDIDVASDELAGRIRARFPGKPVHLVAHSMGGLVARNFIRRHPQLWESMRDAECIAGGRLIMLGTPNYGSYAIPPVLTGEDQMMGLLEKLDLTHNMPELLEITNTFIGSYLLLPAPGKLPPTLQALYQRETWGELPGISQEHLNRTYQFYHDLDSSPTIDPTRMVYIAGCRRVTIDGMSIVGRGDFDYRVSYDGDGRVPHALGLLPDVPTYYVDEVHGDLARNETVLAAVDELLQRGHTSVLGTSVLRRLDRALPRMREYRTAADRRLMEELDRIARAAQAGRGAEDLSEDDIRLGADALIKAALGSGARSLPKGAATARVPPPAAEKIQLGVTVHFEDITRVKTPAVVVGHYRGVEPVNAIGAIDRKLGGWISLAVKQGMIGGSLGETFFIPTSGRIGAGSVVVAGMGDYGTFTAEGLRVLMANVAMGAGALGLTTFATVLVGGGEGSLDTETALRDQFEGIGIGLAQLRDLSGGNAVSVKEVQLVERNPEKFLYLAERLRTLAASDAFANVRIKLKVARAEEVKRARTVRAQEQTRGRAEAGGRAQTALAEVRLTVETVSANQLRFSALTRNAVVPVREVNINGAYARGAAEALQNAVTEEEQVKYGRLLYTYLVPEDFHEFLDGNYPVRLVLDRAAAALPWEMACFPSRNDQGAMRWLGLHLKLSRQFRTLLSRPPGTTPPLNNKLRVLVIADPCPEREFQLPQARIEGRRVVDILKRARSNKLAIEVEARIGAGECDPVEILALLLSGDFDIVHYAGHGDYDPKRPEAAGWVFGQDQVLTATDVFRARKVPRLVFANACFSGVLQTGPSHAPDELSRGLATLAQAFFERGVPNYIGTGWPVEDQQAANLAERFYRDLLRGEAIGNALYEARKAAFEERIDSTWGAYQHYGDPSDRVLRLA